MTEREVASLRRHGRHRVSDNLYLQIGEDGRRSWLFRYQLGGRAHQMGLGSADLRTLAEARELVHAERRRLHLEGVDPLQHRRATAKLDAARGVTFQECAAQYLAAHRSGWRSNKHAQDWTSSIRDHVLPVIGDLSVSSIDTAAVMRVLEPIWRDRTETASRVRGRIESALDWAKVRGYRDGENPARWRGHLDHLLPTKSKVWKVEHHAAMPYTELPVFMVALREEEDIAAKALQFMILTAARSGEVLGARWSEIDLRAAIWTVPAERMKGHREHRVPLSQQAVELLQELPRDGGVVFYRSRHPNRPLLHHSEPVQILRRMGRSETVHGFRSSFRDWAADTTAYPNHVVEQALAHSISNAVEAAYRRGDLFDKRRKLMDAWATFCNSPPVERGDVVPLRARS
jgi:integrase